MEVNPLDDFIVKMTCEFYKRLNFSSSDIQYIISVYRSFIKDIYSVLLREMITKSVLKNQDSILVQQVENVFKNFSDPFAKFSTDKIRLTLYQKLSLFIAPKECELSVIPRNKLRSTTLELKTKRVLAVHIPVKPALAKLFEINGLFETTVSYMKCLEKISQPTSNYIQCDNWKETLKNFKKTDGLLLPLTAFFDDVETGNGMGSHAGVNSVGCAYLTCTVFPPEFASKLLSYV